MQCRKGFQLQSVSKVNVANPCQIPTHRRTYTRAVDAVIYTAEDVHHPFKYAANRLLLGDIDLDCLSAKLAVGRHGETFADNLACSFHVQVPDHYGRGAFFGKEHGTSATNATCYNRRNSDLV